MILISIMIALLYLPLAICALMLLIMCVKALEMMIGALLNNL